MTIEQAREELSRTLKLKKRIEFLQLRLTYNMDYNNNSIDELKSELNKMTKVYNKYRDKVSDRLRNGELIKLNDEKLLTLHYIDGYNYKIIADMLDKKTNNIKSQVHFAVERYAQSYDRPL